MIRKSKSHKNKNSYAARKANKYSTSNYEANETQIINLPQINGTNNSNNTTISNTNSNLKKSGQVVNQVVRDVNGLHIVTEDHETVGVTSIRGLKPNNPNWNNQDNFFVSEKFDQRDIYLYCVLDGHGEVGHYVSRRCREQFSSFIKAANLDMKRAFNMMQNDLMSCDFDTRCSGATCVLICYMEGRLSVSNCGDSRAILGRRNGNGGYIAIPLSNDHKPDKPEERKRILNCGGHVGCRQVLVSQGPRGPVTMPVGPCRVWYQYKGDTLGLAMSRSLGDTIVHKSGVSAEPEILEHIVEEKDEFVIIATDGVWDVIDNNQAIQIIQNFVSKSQTPNWSALEASNWIGKVARGRWEKLSPMVDDITCLVIKLK
jgi:serine/threonine protein phosphatase PrpC